MGNYLNGVGYPIFLIKSVEDDSLIESISLDLCGEEGLTETYEEDFKRNQLENKRYIDFDFKGCMIKFSLDYSSYIKKNNLINIEKLFAYHTNPLSYKLILIPRSDAQARNFEVRFSNPNFSLGIMKGGRNAKGHRLPILEFTTVSPVSKNFIDPDLLSMKTLYKVKF